MALNRKPIRSRKILQPGGPKRNWTDDELVSIVWDFRIAAGACTYGDLSKATGMSRGGLHLRVGHLLAEGRLAQSETVGSIRAADEVLMRQLPDGRLVEVGAKRRRKRASATG